MSQELNKITKKDYTNFDIQHNIALALNAINIVVGARDLYNL